MQTVHLPYRFPPRIHNGKGETVATKVDVLAVVVREVAGLVRAAQVDWAVTARLCIIMVVIAITACITILLLR
jgi:hypothetical protein